MDQCLSFLHSDFRMDSSSSDSESSGSESDLSSTASSPIPAAVIDIKCRLNGEILASFLELDLFEEGGKFVEAIPEISVVPGDVLLALDGKISWDKKVKDLKNKLFEKKNIGDIVSLLVVKKEYFDSKIHNKKKVDILDFKRNII